MIKASVAKVLLDKQHSLERALNFGTEAVQRRALSGALDRYHYLQFALNEAEENLIPEQLNNLQRAVLQNFRKTCTQRR